LACDIVYAVSRLHPTAAARVRSLIKSYGICGGRSGTRAGFLRVLQFSLPILIPLIAPYSMYMPSPTLYSLGTDSVVK
jgi:hypothetical protein